MAENVLGTLFGDIANAIRSKSDDTATMKPNEFPEQIRKISTSNVIDNVEVQLDFANGDQTERLPEGYSANSVTIFKPENLAPENIAKDVNIAGIVGTHEGDDGGMANPYWDMIPQTEITGFTYNEDPGCYMACIEPSPVVPDDGRAYTIVWDNTEYQCVCTMDTYYYYLGNLVFFGGEDSGEPFAIVVTVDGSQVALLSTSDSPSHTIRIIAEKKFYFTKIIEQNDLSEYGNYSFRGTIRHNMGVIPDIALIAFETLEVVSTLNATGAIEAVSSRFAKATGRDKVMTLRFLNGSSGDSTFTGDNGLETSRTLSLFGGIYNGTDSTIELYFMLVHKDAKYRLHLYGGLKLE